MLENIFTIVSLIIIAINIIIAIINFILTKAKKKAIATENEELKSKIEVAEGTINLITKIIPNAVTMAETTGLKGDVKNLLAKSQILIDCSNDGISYENSKDFINNTIESIIELSKVVNTKLEVK